MVVITYPATTIVSDTARHCADIVSDNTSRHGRVLLLLSGGSGIAVYKKMFDWLDNDTDLSNLNVCLVDERYGPYGHPDSNEQQLYVAGIIAEFESRGAEFTGILYQSADVSEPQKALVETTDLANQRYRSLIDQADYVIAFVGLGTDGHSAGWLPTKTASLFTQRYSGDSRTPLVCYTGTQEELGNQYTSRITISLSMAALVDEILIYSAGEGKHAIIEKVLTREGKTHELPVLVWQEQASSLITDYKVTDTHE